MINSPQLTQLDNTILVALERGNDLFLKKTMFKINIDRTIRNHFTVLAPCRKGKSFVMVFEKEVIDTLIPFARIKVKDSGRIQILLPVARQIFHLGFQCEYQPDTPLRHSKSMRKINLFSEFNIRDNTFRGNAILVERCDCQFRAVQQ